MKKLTIIGLIVVAIVAVVLIFAGGVPGSQVANADGGPAIVIKNDGDCGMPGADANGDLTFGGIGIATTIVENGNKVMLKCKGENITNLSGSGQSFSGFGCGWLPPSGGSALVTIDTHASVSASGIGTMTCTFTKP